MLKAPSKPRSDQVFYARTINSHVVSSVSSSISTEDGKTATRSNLPADASPASPAISTISLLLDAASCGYRSRRRAFIDFGEGMLSFLDGESLDSSNCRALPVPTIFHPRDLQLMFSIFQKASPASGRVDLRSPSPLSTCGVFARL